jgi:glutamate synthase domain-containing protein 2
MGISLLGCYHGAQIFEAYGLGREVVDTAFTGSVSRIGGMSFADLQREAESFWAKVRTAGGPGVSGGRGVKYWGKEPDLQCGEHARLVAR